MKNLIDKKLFLLNIISKALHTTKEPYISTEGIFKAAMEKDPYLWNKSGDTESSKPPRSFYVALKYLFEGGALEREIIPSGKQGSPVNVYKVTDFGHKLVADMKQLEAVEEETRALFASIKKLRGNGGRKTPNKVVLEV